MLLALGLLLALGWGVLHVWIVPRIAEYRGPLQTLASQAVGLPVRIGQVQALTTGWVPSLALSDIELLDAQGRTALRLPRVLVAISVRSVLQLGLEQLVIDGPELEVRRNAAGEWWVAGLKLSPGSRDSAVADWLFDQREVLVRAGVVRWHDERQGEQAHPLRLSELDLVLRNSAREHLLRLDATPPGEWGERFVVSGRFRRSLLSQHPGRWQDWSGQVYAFWPHADLRAWRHRLPLPAGLQADLVSGEGRMRMWTDIQRGVWTGSVLDLDLRNLHAVLGEHLQPLQLQVLTGRLSAQRQGPVWTLSTQGLDFRSSDGLPWPGGDVSLRYTEARDTQAASGQLEGQALDLQTLQTLALRLPLSASLHQDLQAWQVRGQLSRLQLKWQGQWPALSSYNMRLQGQDLHIEPAAARAPGLGLRGARLDLFLDEREGRATLEMPRGGELLLGGLLEEPRVSLKQMTAQVQWQRQGDGRWRVPRWSVRLDNTDLAGQLQGSWSPAEAGPGVLDLEGRFARADASRIHRYLPLGVQAKARHYVRDAIVQGRASQVSVRIRGDLSRLPFANPQDGEFRFAGQVRDLQMAYIPPSLVPAGSRAWPVLQSVRGDLVFDRLRMELSAASGLIGEGLQVSNLRADIADMAHQPVVDVQADVRGGAGPALRLVRQSPLGQMLGGILDRAEVSGQLNHRLRLTIPIEHAEKTRVQGSVQLQDNEVLLMPQIPRIERARGQVLYTEQGFELQGVQGHALGGPVQLQGGWRVDAPGQQRSSLSVRAEGQASAQGLRASGLLQDLAPLWERVQGQMAYSAAVGWHAGHPELDIRSDLQGLALQWPQPLGKPAATALPLQVVTRVDPVGKRERMQVVLGDRAAVVYVRELLAEGAGMARALQGSIVLGGGPAVAPALPASGVAGWVQMDHLSLDDWRAMWPQGSVPSGAALQSHWPDRISLQAGTLVLDGRTLHNVSAGITREGRLWRASVDARELSGQIDYQLGTQGRTDRLQARLTRLDLPESAEQDVAQLLDRAPTELPALDIVVEALQLRGKALGRVEVEAVNVESAGPRAAGAREWRLNRLNLRVPEAELVSSGRWSAAAGNLRRTELDVRLELRDAGALLARLGMPEVLRAGSGRLEGRVGWAGTPLALHYPSLHGQLRLDVARGQFLKADPGAAKLLGVLSLQALPRRLLLDFRDVFAEGFSFDQAQGDVRIREGMASTDNLQIRGVNAVVRMQGSADLARETQDLQVLILPEVDAGTASLLAGLAVNPVVGLTSFLAQLFLRQPLRQANTQLYRIDGPWREPRITRLPLPAGGAVPAAPATSEAASGARP